jgi:hypothetical protein
MNWKILCVGSIVVLLVTVGSAQTRTSPSTTTAAAPATATATAPTTLVTGKLRVPADVEAFSDRTADLLLFEYDPRLADAPARQVDHVAIKPFGHEKGKETSVDFRIGTGTINTSRSYYVTAFVLDGTTRTHIGELDGKSGMNKVLTNGNPREITLIVRAVK